MLFLKKFGVDCTIIEEYPDYIITTDGRVFSMKSMKFLTSNIDGHGYLGVTLTNENGSKTKKIHKLVAKAFIANPHHLPQVNHIDGDKTNNNVENLEWCSPSENAKHAYRNGLRKDMSSDNKFIRCIETGEVFTSIKSAARYFGCEVSVISKHLRGIFKSAIGFHFDEITDKEYYAIIGGKPLF